MFAWFDGFEKVYKLSVNELEMKFKKEIAKLELTNDTESKIKQLLMKNKTWKSKQYWLSKSFLLLRRYWIVYFLRKNHCKFKV